jgi:hypothetical protein
MDDKGFIYLEQICTRRFHDPNPTLGSAKRVLSFFRSFFPAFEVAKWLQHQDLKLLLIAHVLDLPSDCYKIIEVVWSNFTIEFLASESQNVWHTQLDCTETSGCDGLQFQWQGMFISPAY